MNFDKKLIKLIKEAKLEFILTLIFGALVALLVIASNKSLAIILDKVFLKNEDFEAILKVVFLFALIIILRSMFMWAKSFYSFKISEKIKNHLRKKLTASLFHQGPANLKSEKSGEISNVLTEGINKLEAYFSSYLPQVFFSLIIPILILIFIFPIDWLSGLVFLLTAPMIPVFMILIGKQAEKVSKKQWKTLNFLSSHFFDVMQGLTTLKLFGRSKSQIRKISEISEDFRKATIGVLKVAFLSALALELLSTISIALVAVEIGIRLIFDKMEFVDGFFVLLLAPEFYLPLRQLGSSFHAGVDGVTASKSIFNIIEKEEYRDSEYSKFKISDNFKIRIENLSFSYDGKNDVLKNINLQIESGKRIAIVGESGAGKSTFYNLLLKFIEPTIGNVFIENVNLKEINREDWLSEITFLSQKPYLFNRTIKENILIANKNATTTMLNEAIEFANLTEFIESLPEGFETIVGEKGVNLSSGQIQRVALARAFLKESKIILLDEPTANLDTELEEELQIKISFLSKNKTVFTIAHRLNTVITADLILVFDKGEIIESGKHKELIEVDGKYANYFRKYRGAS